MLIDFWNMHRILLLGLSFLIGVSLPHSPFALPQIICALFVWAPLLFCSLKKNKTALLLFILSFLVSISGVITSVARTNSFTLSSQEEISGTAEIEIQSLRQQSTLFGNKWVYRCFVRTFIPDDKLHDPIYKFPCQLTLPNNEGLHPNADKNYWVKGRLTQNDLGNNILKISVKTPWIPIPGSYSFAEQRAQWKIKTAAWINSLFPHKETADFIKGLAIGEYDDAWMREQFARFGVQHLLAISGFHFIIIASFVGGMLRLFFPLLGQIIILMVILSLYCFFLGPQASILRAYIMTFLPLVALLQEKQNRSLNTLGIALLLILLYDPYAYSDMGFQLSFATTAAILIFYSPAKTLVSFLIPHRKLKTVIHMNHVNQWGVCCLSFLREGLSLSLAVNIVAFPLTLYSFGSYAIMGLFYNLFYPLCASFSVILFLLGLFFSFLPPLATVIHHFNDLYTLFLLKLITEVPKEIDLNITSEAFSSETLILILCSSFLIGVLYQNKKQSEIY